MVQYLLGFIWFLCLCCVGCQISQKRKANFTVTHSMDKAIEDIISNISEPIIPDKQVDICQVAGFCADEKGTHNFYTAIKKAIDSLDAVGGGTLLFPHSQGANHWIKQMEIYRVKGPIVLKSNIELRFHPGVKLLFEFDPQAYLPEGKPVLRRYEGISLYSYSPCIYAFNAQNIVVSTRGSNGALPIIDGMGQAWQKWSYQGDLRVQKEGKTPAYQQIRQAFNDKDVPIKDRICTDPDYHYLRPTLIEFYHCQNIKIENIKFVQAPFWVVHPVFCRNLIFRNLMYDCPNVNNDGIDVESSWDVLIENVIFDNHDDNIVIKSGRDKEGREGALVQGTPLEHISSPYIKEGRITGPTKNVVIRNCVFKGHYAFCIGSEVSGGVQNIYLKDCIAPIEVAMGVFIKSGRERGGMIEDIFVKNLSIQEARNDAICIIPNYDNDTLSPYPPSIRNIQIQNVAVARAGKGLRVFGWEDAPIKDVQITHIKIEKVLSPNEKDKLLINQVQNLILKDVQIENKDYRGKFTKVEKGKNPPRQN